MESREAEISAIAALDEPTRRRLYDYVVRQPAPVGRDDAAGALELPRTTVAFHLDRLVDEDLLDVIYQRRTGRTGPGAGRPAKTPSAPGTHRGRRWPSGHTNWVRNSAKRRAAPQVTATPATLRYRYWRHTASNPASTMGRSASPTAPFTPWHRTTPNSCAE